MKGAGKEEVTREMIKGGEIKHGWKHICSYIINDRVSDQERGVHQSEIRKSKRLYMTKREEYKR